MELTPEEQRILQSRRIRGLVGALRELGVEIAAQKIAAPAGEPTCHWYFAAPAGADFDHSYPEGRTFGVSPEAPFGHGTSFTSVEEAISRAFGEFAERYLLSRDDRTQFVRASYHDLTHRGVRALDPRTVAGLSDEFRLAHPNHRVSDETVFAWVEGRLFPFWQNILVPAQLVFVPYASGRGEPRIRQPLTTGAAFGWTFAEALWRGLAEVLERDAFMITWLARLTPPRIDLGSVRDPIVRKLIADYASIGIEAHAFDITTDAKVPTTLALLLDRTGAGPAVIVGCRTSFDSTLALRDALRQAHNVRAATVPSVRAWREAGSPPVEIGDSIPNRILFWASPSRSADIAFLFVNPDHLERASSFQRHPEPAKGGRRISGGGPLWSLFRAWRALPPSFGELIAVDVTPTKLKPFGRVVKAILPGAQPLHLSETFPNFGGERLRKIIERSGTAGVHTVPHPFI